VLAQAERPVQELCDEVAAQVADFAGGEVDDDLTVFAIGRLRGPK